MKNKRNKKIEEHDEVSIDFDEKSNLIVIKDKNGKSVESFSTSISEEFLKARYAEIYIEQKLLDKVQ